VAKRKEHLIRAKEKEAVKKRARSLGGAVALVPLVQGRYRHSPRGEKLSRYGR
jgi:hypothetical protein